MTQTERIRMLVKGKGWSLREFFRRLDLDQSTMNAWEKGTASPDKHMDKIASVLGTTEAYLRGETDDPASDDLDIDTSDLSWAMYKDSRELSEEDKRELLAIIQLKKNKGKK